jgi:hypothetical protein
MTLRSGASGPIDRRSLLQWAVAGGTSLLVQGAARGADGRPLFRFVQTNDLHVQAEGPTTQPAKRRGYNRANEKARWLVEAINRQDFCPLPDFVVGVGDLIHGEGLAQFGPDLKMLQEIIRPLRCTFFPVVGNHEVMQRERSPEYLKPYCDAFGKDRVDYTFTRGGILFVALNNAGAPDADAARQRNKWLREVLEKEPGLPKIVFCHIPLIPLREEAILAKSFGFRSYCDRDPGTLAILEEHADKVIAVLSGHLHLTGMKTQRGICHLSLSGTASYPSDGAAVYEVFPDRLEVAVRQLPKALARSQSSIHSKPRHDRDYVDKEHDTPEAYQRGNPQERRFAIALPAGKRPVSGK